MDGGDDGDGGGEKEQGEQISLQHPAQQTLTTSPPIPILFARPLPVVPLPTAAADAAASRDRVTRSTRWSLETSRLTRHANTRIIARGSSSSTLPAPIPALAIFLAIPAMFESTHSTVARTLSFFLSSSIPRITLTFSSPSLPLTMTTSASGVSYIASCSFGILHSTSFPVVIFVFSFSSLACVCVFVWREHPTPEPLESVSNQSTRSRSQSELVDVLLEWCALSLFV